MILRVLVFVALSFGMMIHSPTLHAARDCIVDLSDAREICVSAGDCTKHTMMHVKRGLQTGGEDGRSYVKVLGVEFLVYLGALTPKQRILNVGGGELMFEIEYFAFKHKYASEVVTVSLGAPSKKALEWRDLTLGSRNLTDRHKLFTGKKIEDYRAEELGKFDLIIDVYAAMLYSPDMDDVLTRYGELLNEGGIAVFNIDEAFTKIENSSIQQWIRKSQGFDVLYSDHARIYLRRNSRPLKIRELERIQFKNDYPPRRKFRISK